MDDAIEMGCFHEPIMAGRVVVSSFESVISHSLCAFSALSYSKGRSFDFSPKTRLPAGFSAVKLRVSH